MSATRTITVQSIEARTTPSTGKAYWRVRTDQGTFFVWEKALVDQLPPGATVVVSTNGSAEYPKIVAVHEATAVSAPDPAVDPTPQTFQVGLFLPRRSVWMASATQSIFRCPRLDT